MASGTVNRCDKCGRLVGIRAHRCPTDWSFLSPLPRKYGVEHPGWKGEGAGNNAKRARARRAFTLGSCAVCGRPGSELHHRDRDPGNNSPENVLCVCKRCHRVEFHADTIAKLKVAARRVGERNRQKTECKRGHAYTPENTYVDKHGKRSCMACRREAAREAYRRGRAV